MPVERIITKVRDCPILVSRGRYANQDPLNGPNLDDHKKTQSYALQVSQGDK